MSPKSFIQFHQEGTEISWVQVRCPETKKQRNRQTNLVLEVTPPEVGHLKMWENSMVWKERFVRHSLLPGNRFMIQVKIAMKWKSSKCEIKGSKVYFREPQCISSKLSLIRHKSLFNALPFKMKILNTMRLKRELKKLSVTFKDWRTILQGILATKNPENTVDTRWESPPHPSICLSW